MSLRPYVHVDHALAGAGAGQAIPLSEAELHHLRRVLRLGDGADIEVADGTGSSVLAELEGDGLRLTSAATTSLPPQPEIWVAQGLPKGRKIDEVLQQVTELGVDGVVPVVADRSVTRPDVGKLPRLLARWEGVARAACEQSRRPTRPRIEPPRAATDLDDGAVLIADPGGGSVAEALDTCGDAQRLVLAVGPEGGWSDRELATLGAAGARRVGLGPTVLRTEHAAAAGVAAIQALLGRW